MQQDTIQYLLNYESFAKQGARPYFAPITLDEYNEQHETNHASLDEAIEADPEHCFGTSKSEELARKWDEAWEQKFRDDETERLT